jgi:hypothetical protein
MVLHKLILRQLASWPVAHGLPLFAPGLTLFAPLISSLGLLPFAPGLPLLALIYFDLLYLLLLYLPLL